MVLNYDMNKQFYCEDFLVVLPFYVQFWKRTDAYPNTSTASFSTSVYIILKSRHPTFTLEGSESDIPTTLRFILPTNFSPYRLKKIQVYFSILLQNFYLSFMTRKAKKKIEVQNVFFLICQNCGNRQRAVV